MSAIVLILLAIVIFVGAYLTYGKHLAKSWGIDPSRKTPAHELRDDVDYMPAKPAVLMGHHFSSIAGAGPINGPIQAAFFGWLPCFLWIVIGGIFFGAVQDFGSIFVSIRHEGKSLGEVIEDTMSKKCRVLFTVFAWLVLLLVVAAFADIVANSFAGGGANGSVATASLLFIPLAIVFGFFVYRKNAPMLVASICGVIGLALCVALGIMFPINLPKSVWVIVVFVYIIIASVAPVWILLQPRDYLSSFLLYFMMAAAVIGIVGANPTIVTPAFIGLNVNGNFIFPVLFITIACGAISGFHSLIGSGTTSKQLDNEKDALLIGYGSMLIECVLAVISLITVATLSADGSQAGAQAVIGTETISPTIIFGTAISQFFAQMGFSQTAVTITYTVISLAVSCFCLTSLDTATRLGRFMFQELFAKKKDGTENILSNMYVSTIITVIAAGLLTLAGYTKIWPLFGACNQLVAVPALLALATYLKKIGKNSSALYFPIIFMSVATLTSLAMTFKKNLDGILGGGLEGTAMFTNVLQNVIIVPIVILAVILIVDGFKVLFVKKQA